MSAFASKESFKIAAIYKAKDNIKNAGSTINALQDERCNLHMLFTISLSLFFIISQVKEIARKMAVDDRHCSYDAVSSMFSINIPYPFVGSFTSTWVTAPTSFPS